MDSLSTFLSSLMPAAVVDRLGWLLVHSLWQFVLVAFLGFFLERAMRQCAASTRYLMLLMTLLLMVIAPICTWCMLPVEGSAASAVGSTSGMDELEESSDTVGSPVVSVASAESLPAAGLPEPVATEVGWPADESVRFASPTMPYWSRAAEQVRPWLATLVCAWCAGVLVFSLRPLLGWRAVRRLRSVGVSLADESVQQALICMTRRLGLQRTVQVLQSTLVNAPIVIGGFRSVILLPASFVTGLPITQVGALLAHELAHIRRYDYLVNLAQTLIETLFFYHPAVWWLSHRIRNERENCCDDLVLGVLDNPVEYGRSLLAIEEYRGSAAALALGVRGGSLPARVRRLFQPDVAHQGSVTGSVMGIVLLSVSITAMALWAAALGDQPRLGDVVVNDDLVRPRTAADVTQADEGIRTIDPVPANGEIHGRLIDDETGKPVAGAVVACGAVIIDSQRGGGANTVTDADGKYRLVLPSPGVYAVWLKQYDTDPKMTAVADDGMLVEAGKVTRSQLRLVRGGKVSGKAVDADGRPLVGLTVMCYSAARPQSLGGVQSAKTRGDGSFEFSLPPGSARIYAFKRVASTQDNSLGSSRSGSVNVDVSYLGDMPPVTLRLVKRESKLGSGEWLSRSSPGTQIIRHEDADGVTGTVVDSAGEPIAGVEIYVFRPNLSPCWTNEHGQFCVLLKKGAQSVMRASHPGYRVWFGAPTAGDVLNIVLEKKQQERRPDTPDKTSGGPNATSDARRALRVRIVDSRDASPIAGVTVEAVRWEDPRGKAVDGVTTTNADGIARFNDLDAIRYHWRLSAKAELPYIGDWRSSGADAEEVVIPLRRACELILRAVDDETGRGIPGVKFGREHGGGELWLQVIVPDTLGSRRPVRSSFERKAGLPAEEEYETDTEGYYRCLVGRLTWGYRVYQYPKGYDSIVPINGCHEVGIATPSGQRVEYTFRLVRSSAE
jgi:beta-lactamase regulating signal transducer with metallopeptidase domain